MKKQLSLALLSLSLLTPAVQAQEGYFGIGLGTASYSEDDFEESDTGLNLFVGFTPNENIGLEISYTDFGKQEGDYYGYDASVEVTGLGFSAVGFLPVSDNVDLFAKVGMLSWDADVELGSLYGSDDGTDLMFGFGATIKLSEQFSLRGAWDFVDLDGGDLDMLSINAQINF